MGKINLSKATLNYLCKSVISHLTGIKYRLSLRRYVRFFNTLVLLYFLPVTFIHAQYYNQTSEFLKANSHWAFGRTGGGTGLEFSSGTAQSFSTAITGAEGFATVSSRTTGNLFFYTNGGSVWNANHLVMPNGTGLMGNSVSNSYSALQGSLIVPFINDSNKYYLFSLASGGGLHSNTSTGISGSLFYNIVDMTLDNGNGDIDTNYKNIVLDANPLSEGLVAVPGCNNDIWVIVHSYQQFPQEYKAYHITESGINHTPVVSVSNVNGDFIGSMAVSPDREKIVLASAANNVELSRFDPLSGTISGSVLLSAEGGILGYRSAAFSPDNSKLYVSHTFIDFSTFTVVGGLVQYDIAVFDSTAIDTSKQTINNLLSSGIRLYNDTIYTADYNYTALQAVHRINQPNNSGTACDFQFNAIILTGSNTEATLGSDVVFAIPPDTLFTALDTIICIGWEEGVTLTAANALYTDYSWSTGDTIPSVTISGQGVYWVKYRMCNHHYVDSFIIRGSDLFTTITVNGFELGITGGPFASYQWYLNGEPIPGANRSIHTVTENGHYTVEITDNYGCVYISDVYEVTNVNVNDLQQLSGTISIYPNPATEKINIDAPVPVQVILTGIDGKELFKGNNTSPVHIGSLAQGFYFLTVTDIEGRFLKIEKIIKQ